MRSLTTLSQPNTSLTGENDRVRAFKTSPQNTSKAARRQNGKGVGVLALALLAIGLYYGGFFARLSIFLADPLERYFLNTGVVLQKIRIKGQVTLGNEQIIKALGVAPGHSLIGFDAIKAQKQLARLGQVRSARVMRLLPSTLLVEIVERVPVARWFHDGRMELIDRHGVVLRGLRDQQGDDYPLVVGRGANDSAAQLIRLLSAHSALAGRIKMAERVGQYRWNLHAKNGAMIKLPPLDLALGLARLVQLPDWSSLLGQKRLVIDLRHSSQAFVRQQSKPFAPVVSNL